VNAPRSRRSALLVSTACFRRAVIEHLRPQFGAREVSIKPGQVHAEAEREAMDLFAVAPQTISQALAAWLGPVLESLAICPAKRRNAGDYDLRGAVGMSHPLLDSY